MKLFHKTPAICLLCVLLVTQLPLWAQNVGIGTATPAFRLDLVGRMRIQASTLNNASTSSGIWMTDYRDNSNIIFTGMADTVNYGFWSQRAGIGWQAFFDARYGNMGIGMKPNSGRTKLVLNDADGAALGLYYNNGYRGGLLANDSTLEIRGLYQSPLCFPLPCTPPPASDIVIWPVEACTGTGCILQNSPGRTGFYTTSPNSRMHIVASTGALGVTIGNRNLTPATGYMLSVGGKIICEELKVQLTNNNAWPDYVFEEKYNLPSIDAYEQQVRTQKHLPGIPSAADVQAQNGIELGEMQRKMLEKLEEMSLFIFELNKKNKQLEAEIEKLKAGKGH